VRVSFLGSSLRSGDIAGQYLGYVVGRQLAFRSLSGGNEAGGRAVVGPGGRWRFPGY